MSEHWVNSVRQSKLCYGEHAHMHALTRGHHFKKWKAKQALYDAAKCHTPCRDNDDKYYGIQHDLKKVFEPHVDISAIYLWPQDDAKVQATKTWFDMGIFQVDGRASTCGYLVDKTPCYTLFGTVHPKLC